jgi:molybdate transport system permease protein
MDWRAIELSLRLSTLTTFLLLILGLPLASWLAFSRWRWKFFIEAFVALPIVLPPTVLGFYVLIAIGPHSPIGQAYMSITGRGLPFSFQGLLVASVLYSLPFAVQPFTAAFSTVDQRQGPVGNVLTHHITACLAGGPHRSGAHFRAHSR